MPFRLGRAMAVLVFVSVSAAASLGAEEYDVTVVFRDEAPVMAPFFRCLRNATVAATEETLPVCRMRESESERTFEVPAVRITNLGTSVIWVHFGTAKLPVLPGKHFRRRAPGNGTFDRVFVSGTPDGVAHIFASSSGADEPEAQEPKRQK